MPARFGLASYGVARTNFRSRKLISTLPIVSAAIWSAADKNSNIVISGADLVATDSSGVAADHAGRGDTATTTIGSGIKRFWKVVPNVLATQIGVGVCNAIQAFADTVWLGSSVQSVGWYNNGAVYTGGGGVATFGTYVQGDTLGIAVTGAGMMWGSVNGVFTGDPVAGTGGVDISGMGDVFPAYDLQGNDSVTAIFAASDAPSGFSAFP